MHLCQWYLHVLCLHLEVSVILPFFSLPILIRRGLLAHPVRPATAGNPHNPRPWAPTGSTRPEPVPNFGLGGLRGTWDGNAWEKNLAICVGNEMGEWETHF